MQGVISQLRQWGGEVAAELDRRKEHVIFALPKALRDVAKLSTSLTSEDAPG